MKVQQVRWCRVRKWSDIHNDDRKGCPSTSRTTVTAAGVENRIFGKPDESQFRSRRHHKMRKWK